MNSPATGTPSSTSISPSMSITWYRMSGGPAGAMPCWPSVPNSSGNPASMAAGKLSMVTVSGRPA